MHYENQVTKDELLAEFQRARRNAYEQAKASPEAYRIDHARCRVTNRKGTILFDWATFTTLGNNPEKECKVPPPGWQCSRGRGHTGPCAATPKLNVVDGPEGIDMKTPPGTKTASEVCAAAGTNVDPNHSVPEGFAANIIRIVRERGSAYGSPSDNHQTTADIWSSWLSRRVGQNVKLSAEDVCMLNILQKASRAAFCSKDDTVADIAGYAENIAMLRRDQRNKGEKKNEDIAATPNEQWVAHSSAAPFRMGDVVQDIDKKYPPMTVWYINKRFPQIVTSFEQDGNIIRTNFRVSQLILVHRFNVGDVVHLNIMENPKMTIQHIFYSSPKAVCQWFTGNKLCKEVFDIPSLRLART